MLEQVLRYINNRFDRDPKGCAYGSISGAFTVEDGFLNIDKLLEGQYFWVEGSVMNDGLHLYPDSNMKDETFVGRIVFLVIPENVIDLAAQIEMWNEKNADLIGSPFQSESFGGYSYTRMGAGSNEGASEPWQVQFGPRLRPYRKLSREWA